MKNPRHFRDWDGIIKPVGTDSILPELRKEGRQYNCEVCGEPVATSTSGVCRSCDCDDVTSTKHKEYVSVDAPNINENYIYDMVSQTLTISEDN